jgi:hypothetical protein
MQGEVKTALFHFQSRRGIQVAARQDPCGQCGQGQPIARLFPIRKLLNVMGLGHFLEDMGKGVE